MENPIRAAANIREVIGTLCNGLSEDKLSVNVSLLRIRDLAIAALALINQAEEIERLEKRLAEPQIEDVV